MSTDEAPQDVSQVTDFHFHAARKFRLFVEGGCSQQQVRNRLATSTQLGVTFALIAPNQMTCFPTRSLLDFKLTRENMNTEETELPVKTISLQGVESINDIGINSDGTLLAVLHTKNNDVSVDVYDIRSICTATEFRPICSTRIGTDPVNQGTCVEWNPAFPDTFAAASTDRSLLVAKIDVKDPKTQKLVGIGKLGAITTAISWSPKGKQLTIGDSLGKIVQLKPELDVVRSQFGPNEGKKVTGLCWLATTEWLVSFERGTDHDAYLMRCKKDKPTEWMQYHELSYSSSKWPLPPQLFPSAQLLVDWNVVLVGNSKTSEITTVGKRDEWQTWVPVEGEGIYLPTTASGKDTVAVGVAVDRSMTAEVALNAEGTQKHRPSPLILCLTNDGILTVHHVISTFEAHKPCQIPSQNIVISGLQKRQFNGSKTPEPPRTPTTPAAAPMALFQQTSAPKPLIPATTPLSAPKPAIPTTPTKRVIPEDPRTPEDTKEKELMAKKKLLVEKWIHLNREMISTKDSVMKMGFAIGRVKSTVLECAEVVKSSLGDSKEVMEELRSLILVMERMSERTQHTVKDMDFEIYEKMELVSKVEEGETVVDALRSSSETEKLMRFNKLEASADALAAKFEDVTDQMKKLKAGILEKETMRKQAVLSPFRQKHGPETDVALKVMRNVSKIIVDTRDRIQRTELDFVRFQREKTVPKGSQKKKGIQKPMEISVLEGDAPRNAKLTDAEILKARQALVARIQKRGLVKTREIQTESYRTPREPKKREEIDTTSLSNAILKLSMTPRRVIPASSFLTPDHLKPTKSDATTQADEPPVIQKVLVEKQNVEERIVETTPKTMPEQKPPASSIFPGSLFGAKTQSPGSGSIFGGKSSIFGGQVTPKKEEVEAKREEPKEQLLQNPKDPIPKAEPPKVVEEAKVDPPKVDVVPKETPKPEIPKPEEKELIPKVEEPPKPSEPLAQVVEEQKTPIKVDMEKEPEEPKKETPKASFSFNTTPKTTSSIFGGGLQTTPGTGGSSSIFGSKAPVTTTPSSSIFGGGLKTTTASPFGSFGQTAAPPTTSQPVSFSFNTGAPATQSKGFFGGSTAPSKPSSVFGGAVAAPSVPSVDDGMEDDSVSGGGPGGFMSGLGGSAPSTTTASSNLFAPKQPTTTTTSNSWLFGGGAQQNQASKPSFSFATPSSSTASPPSAASTNSVFGAAPKFGSQPVFGAKPFGGGAPGLSKNASIFGGGATTGGSGGGFAQFAGGQKTSVFGGGAQQPATNASIFGGGAQTPAAPASSIFGGGSSANANKPSSFSSWR